jgi:hypothetical protein
MCCFDISHLLAAVLECIVFTICQRCSIVQIQARPMTCAHGRAQITSASQIHEDEVWIEVSSTRPHLSLYFCSCADIQKACELISRSWADTKGILDILINAQFFYVLLYVCILIYIYIKEPTFFLIFLSSLSLPYSFPVSFCVRSVVSYWVSLVFVVSANRNLIIYFRLYVPIDSKLSN